MYRGKNKCYTSCRFPSTGGTSPGFDHKRHCHLTAGPLTLKFHVTFKVRLLAYKCLHISANTSVIRFTSTPLLAWCTRSSVNPLLLLRSDCRTFSAACTLSASVYNPESISVFKLNKAFFLSFICVLLCIFKWFGSPQDHNHRPYSQTHHRYMRRKKLRFLMLYLALVSFSLSTSSWPYSSLIFILACALALVPQEGFLIFVI